MFKVNNEDSTTMHFDVFIVNLEHISHLFSGFNVNFEQLVACWNWTINV